jgi:hypothetical protein
MPQGGNYERKSKKDENRTKENKRENGKQNRWGGGEGQGYLLFGLNY